MKLLDSKLFYFIVLLIYFIFLIIFIVSFIFIGEDTELNTFSTYLYFSISSLVFYGLTYLLAIYKENKILKVVILVISTLILPLLISGYLGAKGVEQPIWELAFVRLIAVLINISLVAILFTKLCRQMKLKG